MKLKGIFLIMLILVSLTGFNLNAYGAENTILQYHSSHVNPINANAKPAAISKSYIFEQTSKTPTYTTKASFISSIHSILADRQTSAKVHITTSEFNWQQIKDVFMEALESADDYDHYNYHGYEFSMYGSPNNFDLTMNISYLTTKSQETEVSEKVTQLLTGMIKDGMSNDRKVKLIHDWVVKNVMYDQTLSEYSAYAGFLKGTTVCNGYSLMIYKMLKQAGVNTRIITSETHAWNLVQLHNNYYHLDSTWDDPVPDRGPNTVSYEYYNLTDAELKKNDDENNTHSWDTSKFPQAVVHYSIDDLNALIYAVDALTWTTISSQPADSITKSLTLPGTGKYGSTVQWKSTNPAISNTGAVTRPKQSNSSGLLIATVTSGDISEEKDFSTTVLADNTIKMDRKSADSHKIWTIKFNTSVNATTINMQTISVKDANGNTLLINVTAGDDGKSAVVSPPPTGYILGQEYSLEINTGIKSIAGSYLKNVVIMPFIIE